MSEWQPKKGEFVARYTREWNGARFIGHVMVERVARESVLAGGVRYKRPKPKPGVDPTRWSESNTRRYPCLIGPALEPQEKIRAEHEAEQERLRHWRLRQAVEARLRDVDMAQLREVAQLLGVEVSDG